MAAWSSRYEQRQTFPGIFAKSDGRRVSARTESAGLTRVAPLAKSPVGVVNYICDLAYIRGVAYNIDMISPSELFALLSDPTRLRALMLIHAEGEACVCEMTCALEQSQPKISRHLAVMREAGSSNRGARAPGSTIESIRSFQPGHGR